MLKCSCINTGAESTSSLPPKEETYDEDTQLKTVVEYSINDQGKKVKVIKTYRVNRVSKAVARRMVGYLFIYS